MILYHGDIIIDNSYGSYTDKDICYRLLEYIESYGKDSYTESVNNDLDGYAMDSMEVSDLIDELMDVLNQLIETDNISSLCVSWHEFESGIIMVYDTNELSDY
jgi:hypothetical protein